MFVFNIIHLENSRANAEGNISVQLWLVISLNPAGPGISPVATSHYDMPSSLQHILYSTYEEFRCKTL